MKTNSKRAFTFLELIAVVAVSASVLALFVLPSLARSKTRSPAAGCLSNLRQLMTGWQMYADDNRGRLMINAPVGANPSRNWVNSSTGWGPFPDNTNTASVLSGSMGKYVNSNVVVFRCPGDVVGSANGPRLRSYSMNGQIGPASGVPNYGAPLRTYGKEADITCPAPKNLFVLCDEHPGTMDDAYLQVSANGYFPNVPASYLDGGCGFGFADGHGEIHKWQGTALLIPVVFNSTFSGPTISTNDPDWIWWKGKEGCQ